MCSDASCARLLRDVFGAPGLVSTLLSAGVYWCCSIRSILGGVSWPGPASIVGAYGALASWSSGVLHGCKDRRCVLELRLYTSRVGWLAELASRLLGVDCRFGGGRGEWDLVGIECSCYGGTCVLAPMSESDLAVAEALGEWPEYKCEARVDDVFSAVATLLEELARHNVDAVLGLYTRLGGCKGPVMGYSIYIEVEMLRTGGGYTHTLSCAVNASTRRSVHSLRLENSEGKLRNIGGGVAGARVRLLEGCHLAIEYDGELVVCHTP